MMLWWMWIRSLDLDKAFGTNRLITATCFVQMWWVVHKTDGTFGGVLVQKSLDPLAVDIRVFGKV
jgi:hypothetical protein